jgi:hypothetical protein
MPASVLVTLNSKHEVAGSQGVLQQRSCELTASLYVPSRSCHSPRARPHPAPPACVPVKACYAMLCYAMLC